MVLFNGDGKINEDVFDALYELGNVGIGMASVALGKILGMRVIIDAPNVVPVDTDIAKALSLNREQEAVGILMTLEVTLGGAVLFIVDKQFMVEAVEIMTGVRYEGNDLVEDEDALSAVQELANIMGAACMKAIGGYTQIKIFLSPVMVGIDLIGALIDFPIAQLELDCEKLVFVDTRFSLMNQSGERSQDAGHILFLPDGPSVKLLMEALGL